MHIVKICIFCHFFGRHLELHKKYCNLAIENSFNICLDLLNVILVTKIFFQIAWGNAGRRDGQTWEAVIAVTAVPDFKTVKKFATAVTVRIRNLAGRSKTALTQQNVTVRNKRQQNFETVRSVT